VLQSFLPAPAVEPAPVVEVAVAPPAEAVQVSRRGFLRRLAGKR